MNPSLVIPTDNIAKFFCLFGLALVVVSVYAFVSTYTATLADKVRYSEAIIMLEAKTPLAKAEENVLKLNKRLLEVTIKNGEVANIAVGLLGGAGISISFLGLLTWYRRVQQRDDELAKLQIEKLKMEIAKLRSENLTSKYSRMKQR
jgi:transketolase C-terminal domain/subunit